MLLSLFFEVRVVKERLLEFILESEVARVPRVRPVLRCIQWVILSRQVIIGAICHLILLIGSDGLLVLSCLLLGCLLVSDDG